MTFPALQKAVVNFLLGIYLVIGIDQKILVSVKLWSAILGPEMAAPILRTRGKIAFFLQEKPCP